MIYSDVQSSVLKKTLYILNKWLNKFTRDCYMKYPKLSHFDKSLYMCVYIWTYTVITTKHDDKTKLFWCLLIWRHLAHRNSPGFMSRMPSPFSFLVIVLPSPRFRRRSQTRADIFWHDSTSPAGGGSLSQLIQSSKNPHLCPIPRANLASHISFPGFWTLSWGK